MSHYKDPVATLIDSLYFTVFKNRSDYITLNEQIGEAYIEGMQNADVVAFTFLPRETEGTSVRIRAVELVHKTSDSDSSIFKTPTPTPS
jgi:hypothetical protein